MEIWYSLSGEVSLPCSYWRLSASILMTARRVPISKASWVSAETTFFSSFIFLSISLLFSLGEGAEQLGGWVNRKALFSTLNSVKVFQSSLSFSDFSPGFSGVSPAGQEMVDANLQKLTQLVNKESNLIEKVGWLQSLFSSLWELSNVICVFTCLSILSAKTYLIQCSEASSGPIEEKLSNCIGLLFTV